ncbi:MAG: DUF4390 domain-containing protein [Pseudomonadota bacterium]
MTNLRRRRTSLPGPWSWLRACVLALAVVAWAQPARADEGRVEYRSLVSYVIDGNVMLESDVTVRLSGLTRAALQSGVALEFDVEIDVIRQRSFWPDLTLRRYQIPVRLSYQDLTRSYRLERLNSGQRASFPDLDTALDAVAQLRDVVLIPDDQLSRPGRYYGVMRVRLDLDALPSPLRTQAYFSRAWTLKNGEQTWPLR